MTQSLTIDQAGRIVLPAELRRRLGLVPGSRLTLDVVAQRIELTPEPRDEVSLVNSASRRRVLPPIGRPSDAGSTVRAERDARAERSPEP